MYKTEKRPAEVGDQILIVAKYFEDEPYEIGDVLEVKATHSAEGLVDETDQYKYDPDDDADGAFTGICLGEYEVILKTDQN